MGVSGRIARAFLQSKLTPLMTLAALVLGAIGMVATPREEEPQISVPMIDVIVGMPGATPAETENLLVRPLEKRLYEIAGVDHVYSVAGDGYAMVTARFDVGEDQVESITKVHAKLFSVADEAPSGATQPLVKPHSIDDVPIVTLTLHSERYDSDQLRQVALHLEDEVRAMENVAQTFIVGGQPKQITVSLDPARMAARGVTPGEVAGALEGANARLQAGDFAAGNRVYRVDVGAPLATAGEVGAVVVSTRSGGAVYVRDVADVREGFGQRESYVFHATRGGDPESAVTLAVAKRAGANATELADQILERVDHTRDRILPAGVEVEVTRNYGETAGEKASELIFHLLVATLSVTLLIGVFLGWREAVVVLVAVPVTLALTLFVYYAFGYTLNRITLFALIFSIGILVDDAIVVVENIYRHMKMKDRAPDVAAVQGVDEVGNPTILATLTVIAAILPMAVVSGMMGPYMRPIPVGASVAMLASLAVAFVVTPWLSYKLLKGHVGEAVERRVGSHEHEEEGGFARLYGRIMNPLIDRRKLRWATYGVVLALLAGSISLVFVRAVEVKMLPFDNKSEFQVILDLPEGSTLETSQAAAHAIAGYLRTVPEVETTQVYAGTASPFNFNGLVRHYYMRSGPNVADVQVNLAPKHHRDRQSHDIAVAVRPAVDSIARLYDARAKVAEIPPGPPVLSTLVAEVYGPDEATRLATAQTVMDIFESTEGVVDVDWTVEAGEARHTLRVDRVRAAQAGASVDQITRTLYLAMSGSGAGVAPSADAREGVQIVPRLALADRSSLESLLAIPVATAMGPQPMGRFASIETSPREGSRHRRDLRPLVYVTGDVAGEVESPVYAILGMNERLSEAGIAVYNARQPERLDETAIKWDGEWQVTIDVFRDLAIAFAVVLLLIYVLVVGWFQSFTVPLVIMAPIPLTLVGILPGHAVGGAFFTATSMIGMIALAGIIVRNSILLVDFIQLAEDRGRTLREAVLEAGAVRFRPIALTAAAVMVGGGVMVLDPIFEGLAVALISGALAATLLTMVIVPLLYWELRNSNTSHRPAENETAPDRVQRTESAPDYVPV